MKYKSLFLVLGWHDVKQAYRRSRIGPFWLTIGMAVQILAMGIVFGAIFQSDIQSYLPFLSIGIIFWSFLSNTLIEGCSAFISSEGIIKQLNIPFSTYILKVVWSNLITLGHNLVIIPILFIALRVLPNWNMALLIPGIMLVILNITWMVAVLALTSSRFRDFLPITASILSISFYLTPIMWNPSLLPDNDTTWLLLNINPFFHMIDVVRSPLLGIQPELSSWVYLSLLSFVGILSTLLVYRRFERMIAYWL